VCVYVYCIATVFGKGVYFAVKFSYSALVTYSPPDSNGVKYVFQCRVLTGLSTVGNSSTIEPPCITDSKRRYDSVTNNLSNPEIFVVFKDMQVYPEYMVSFRCT